MCQQNLKLKFQTMKLKDLFLTLENVTCAIFSIPSNHSNLKQMGPRAEARDLFSKIDKNINVTLTQMVKFVVL